MERFALAAAVVLGFALTAACAACLCRCGGCWNAANKTAAGTVSSPACTPARPAVGWAVCGGGHGGCGGRGLACRLRRPAGAAGQRGPADDTAAHGAGRKPCLWGSGSCRGSCPDAQPGGAGAAAGRPPFAGGTGRGIRSFAAAGSGLSAPGTGRARGGVCAAGQRRALFVGGAHGGAG